jgi:hypothetical protein
MNMSYNLFSLPSGVGTAILHARMSIHSEPELQYCLRAWLSIRSRNCNIACARGYPFGAGTAILHARMSIISQQTIGRDSNNKAAFKGLGIKISYVWTYKKKITINENK